jgi:hypothetical protein
MKSIHDYHLSVGALLSDIKHSLYKAPLNRGQLYIASAPLLPTIQAHLDKLKEEYRVPYEIVTDDSKPLAVYSGLWRATQAYNRFKDLATVAPDGYQPSFPFLVLVNPSIEGGFPYNIVSDALSDSDPFLEPGDMDSSFEKSVEHYNMYNATSLPTSFSCKCNIIIITDVDMSWRPEPYQGGLLPAGNTEDKAFVKAAIEFHRLKDEHDERVNPKKINYRGMNSLFNKATRTWIRPDFVVEEDTETTLVESYKKVFDANAGRSVLADLERVANQTKIDANSPDSNAAVWKCAQLALIQRVRNQLEK